MMPEPASIGTEGTVELDVPEEVRNYLEGATSTVGCPKCGMLNGAHATWCPHSPLSIATEAMAKLDGPRAAFAVWAIAQRIRVGNATESDAAYLVSLGEMLEDE